MCLHSMDSAPKDRPVVLWFPFMDMAAVCEWKCIEGGEEDGTGSVWAWVFDRDELSSEGDGIVWDISPQPSLWMDVPNRK